MKTVRTTLKYALVLILLFAGIGGWYAHRQWTNRGKLIRQQIVAHIAHRAPHWNLSMEGCSLDLLHGVRLENVQLKASSQSMPVAVIPQVTISLDVSEFFGDGTIRITKVRLVRPTLNLVQDGGGQWNWEQLLPWPSSSGVSLPECEVEQARVCVRKQWHPDAPATTLVFSDANLSLVPSGRRRFLVEGAASVTGLGRLAIDGRWDVDSGTGTINGEIHELALDRNLMQVVSQAVPPLSERVAVCRRFINDRLRGRTHLDVNGPYREASGSGGSHGASNALSTRVLPPASADSTAQPRTDLNASWSQTGPVPLQDDVSIEMSALGHVNFRVSKPAPDSEPEFKVLLEVLRGEVKTDLIPYTATKLAGKLYFDNQHLVARDISVSDGSVELGLEGAIPWCQPDQAAGFNVSVRNIVCDERLRSQLSGGMLRVYDMLRPQGLLDTQVKVIRNPNGEWQPQDLMVTAKNGSFLHTLFPYPIDSVHGTMTQKGHVLNIRATGSARGQPVTILGSVKNPGPQAESRFDIHVSGLAIDRTFLAACRPEVQKTVAALNLEGIIDADLTLTKVPPQERFQPYLSLRLSQGTLQYDRFPYRIQGLTGRLTYSTDRWTFEELAGVHSGSRLQAFGHYTKTNDVGQLNLTVMAQNAMFDESLRLALSPSLQNVWNQVSPAGNVNLTCTIGWTQNQPAQIALRDIEVFDGRIEPTAFPYAFNRIRASCAYEQGILRVTAFRGLHGDTEVTCQGAVRTDDRGDWTMRCEDLTVNGLVPNNEFRRALPVAVCQVFECLHPNQPVAMRGMLELRGTPRPSDPVTAAWDLEMEMNRADVTVGMDYKEVVGTVRAKGIWNGYETSIFDGRISLQEAKVLGHQLTDIRGPFYVKEGMLVVGSRDAILPKSSTTSSQNAKPAEHVTAKAIDGVITLDAVSTLQDDPTYRIRLLLTDGKLERYAALYIPGQKDLHGIMKGWIVLSGRGNDARNVRGRGQLQIQPAALYELPVLVQVFNVMSFAPPDRTAFRYALLDFGIADERFQFNGIYLDGNTVSLRGHGTAGFDGALNLNFYSMLPRHQIPIPVVNTFVREATRGWVGIEVRGKVDTPIAKTKPMPQFDDTLKGFLGALPNLTAPVLPPPPPPPTQPIPHALHR